MSVPTPAVSGKSVLQSWTMWLNFGTLAFLVAVATLPEVAALVPAADAQYLVAAVAVANLALRYFRTSQPITSIT